MSTSSGVSALASRLSRRQAAISSLSTRAAAAAFPQVEPAPAGGDPEEDRWRLLQAVTAFDERLRRGFTDRDVSVLRRLLERLRSNAAIG